MRRLALIDMTGRAFRKQAVCQFVENGELGAQGLYALGFVFEDISVVDGVLVREDVRSVNSRSKLKITTIRTHTMLLHRKL